MGRHEMGNQNRGVAGQWLMWRGRRQDDWRRMRVMLGWKGGEAEGWEKLGRSQPPLSVDARSWVHGLEDERMTIRVVVSALAKVGV